MMCRLVTVLIGTTWLALAGPAWSHQPSDSYLSLNFDTGPANGQWDIALRDLEYALGLDTDRDGAITWGELRPQIDRVADYALSHLQLTTEQRACPIRMTRFLVDDRSDGGYAILRLAIVCPGDRYPDHVDYRLFFDLDTAHRGLLRVQHGASAVSAVLSPAQSGFDLAPHAASFSQTFVSYWREGVWHIWVGLDHVLFLITLVLPLVLGGTVTAGAQRYQSVLVRTVTVVTAFTVAHSITLSLAVLDVVTLPVRWVEIAIAFSVVVVSLNNLKPLLPHSNWVFSFGFGLLHGFGFANVLVDLGLPGKSLAVALLGFNLGVETGQIVIIGVTLPLLTLFANTLYRSIMLKGTSTVIASVAMVWCLERFSA